MQRDISDQTMSVLEWCVVLLYDWTSSIMEVNAARKELFTKKSSSLENLPPTLAALKLQIKWACYHFNNTHTRVPKQPQGLGWEK